MTTHKALSMTLNNPMIVKPGTGIVLSLYQAADVPDNDRNCSTVDAQTSGKLSSFVLRVS